MSIEPGFLLSVAVASAAIAVVFFLVDMVVGYVERLKEEESFTLLGNINAGDAVKLKSGGPLMTVIDRDQNRADVRWYDEKGQKRFANVPIAKLLKKVQI